MTFDLSAPAMNTMVGLIRYGLSDVLPKAPPGLYPPHVLVELQNLSNELQNRLQRWPKPVEDDELLR